MTCDEIFAAWAPKGFVWTPWVKPVLFAYVNDTQTPDVVVERPKWLADITTLEESSAKEHPHRSSARTRDVALVIDLPGEASVRAGVAALQENFFPVPLFNALPHAMAIVPMQPLIDATIAGTSTRAQASLTRDAKPSFLLDSRRRGEGISLRPGRFDNRSVTFATDFPSAKTLLDAVVQRVVIVHDDEPAVDLVSVLLEWQRAGIAVYSKRIDRSGSVKPITLRSLGLITRVAHWWMRHRLFRSPKGTFGGLIGPASG